MSRKNVIVQPANLFAAFFVEIVDYSQRTSSPAKQWWKMAKMLSDARVRHYSDRVKIA